MTPGDRHRPVPGGSARRATSWRDLGDGQLLALRAAGMERLGTSGTAPSGVLVSAYTNPANNALSIVAINSNTSSANVSFHISGAAPCSLTPYETSASKNLGQGSAVTVSQSRVSVTLAAQSVTTFVGTP